VRWRQKGSHVRPRIQLRTPAGTDADRLRSAIRGVGGCGERGDDGRLGGRPDVAAVGIGQLATARGPTGVARFAITVNGVSGEQVVNGTAALPTNQWVHVAVTLSGGVGTLYLNGRAVGTNSGMLFAPFRLGASSQNWLGRSQYATDRYFNGLIDDFASIGAHSAGRTSRR
jgi:hypothetical protein